LDFQNQLDAYNLLICAFTATTRQLSKGSKNMSHQFFQTMMGRRFYEQDVPDIAKSLRRIAIALEKINEVKYNRIDPKEPHMDGVE